MAQASANYAHRDKPRMIAYEDVLEKLDWLALMTKIAFHSSR